MNIEINVYVEGNTDKLIVAHIVRLAFPFNDKINVVTLNAMLGFSEFLLAISKNETVKSILLLSSDFVLSPNLHYEIDKYAHNTTICRAEQNIDSWVFADELTLKEAVKTDKARNIIEKMPFPEQIPQSKWIRNSLVKGVVLQKVLLQMNIERAEARSPSLKRFLNTIRRLIGEDTNDVRSYTRTLNRGVFSNLISEVVPDKIVVFRALDGTDWTAREMLKELENGTDMGNTYISTLLRVARDLLINQAELQDEEEVDSDD